MSDVPTPTGYQRSQGGGFKWVPPSAEHLAKLLPQYDIECLLGHGGMGAVYKGRQRSLNRPVAIKILPQGLEDEDASYTERFKNEAQILARLSHPCIVAAHDFGETSEGQLYIVMEFVDGTDVAQMIRSQGRLPPEHALAVAAHVCDALSYAHKNGVVHRDIKPANILINHEGAVKVADFGLAKVDEPSTNGLTKTGMAMGTPDYVAPEALIMGTQIDGRADLYAIGVMLYHMLTGEVPRGAFDLPSRRFGTDPRFDAIILKAMKMDREERYQSSGEIRHDLDVILSVPLVQAGGTSSAAIPQHRSADAPIRKQPSPRQSTEAQPADEGIRTPFDPSLSHSPHPKSKATMITLASTAAVLATGAFLVLKPKPEVMHHSDSKTAVVQSEVPPTRTAPAVALPAPKPILVAQANTTPKLSVDTSKANPFIGEWETSGSRVHSAIVEDGTALLIKPDGNQDRSSDGKLYWDGWRWKLSGNKIEIVDREGLLKQAWTLKDDGSVTVEHHETEKSWVETKTRASVSWKTAQVSSAIASGPPADAVRFGNHHYKLISEVLSSDDAQKRCVSMGGHLATITSKEEHLVIQKLQSTAAVRVMLGGWYDGKQWLWITGEPWDYVDWDPKYDATRTLADQILILPSGGHFFSGAPRTTASSGVPTFICEWEGGAASPVVAQALTTPPAAPPAAPLPPELTTLQQQYDKLLVERVTGLYDADVAKLNAGYLAGLDRAAATAQSGGELDAVLAIQEEKKLITAKLPVPATDDAKTPEALKNLRTIFRTSLAKLDEQRTANHTALLTPYATRLKQIEADLTKAGRIPDAVAVKQYRESLGTNPVPAAVAQAPTAPPTPTTPVTSDDPKLPKADERQAAEWVLGIGGSIFIKEGAKPSYTLNSKAGLPKGKFQILDFKLDGKTTTGPVNAESLKVLAGLKDLTSFWMDNIELADEELSFIGTFPNLIKLEISHDSKFTGSAVKHLAKLRSLTEFTTFSTAFNDEAVALLVDCKGLTRVMLGGNSNITNACIPHLDKLPKLQSLSVSVTQVTPGGLAQLQTQLATLGMNLVSGESIQPVVTAVAPKQPQLSRVILSHRIPDDTLTVLKAFPKLTVIDMAGAANEGLLDGLGDLPGLVEFIAGVPFKLTDAGLMKFVPSKKLKKLTIKSTTVTDAGIAAFKKARPDVTVTR